MSASETGGRPARRHPPVVYDGMSQSESDGGLRYLPNSHSPGKDVSEIRITDSGAGGSEQAE